MMDDEAKARRELLLKIYGASIDEYRFNVLLTWDRTKFFLLLNSGLIAAGIGLLKIAEGSLLTSIFLILFFILSIGFCAFGLETATVGKSYYREAIFTKTLVERELGLLDPIPGLDDSRANLSIAVTQGQRNYQAILSGETRTEPGDTSIARGTVAWNAQMAFWTMIVIDAGAAIAALINASVKAGP
jgi:hypothetical protein